MFNFEEICLLDDLNPIKRYHILKTHQSDGHSIFPDKQSDLGEIMLIALYAIDLILKKECKVKHNYYILGDATVQYLIEAGLNISLDPDYFKKAIVGIDEAKLIYRFTVAKKFSIANDRIKQLRLNSWGREYLNQHDLLLKYDEIYDKMYKLFSAYFEEHKQVYANVAELLLREIDTKVAAEIQKLNGSLQIKLLS